MAVPKYYEMYHSFLQSLSDGEEHPYSNVKKKVIEDFKLTDIELAELLPSHWMVQNVSEKGGVDRKSDKSAFYDYKIRKRSIEIREKNYQ